MTFWLPEIEVNNLDFKFMKSYIQINLTDIDWEKILYILLKLVWVIELKYPLRAFSVVFPTIPFTDSCLLLFTSFTTKEITIKLMRTIITMLVYKIWVVTVSSVGVEVLATALSAVNSIKIKYSNDLIKFFQNAEFYLVKAWTCHLKIKRQ